MFSFEWLFFMYVCVWITIYLFIYLFVTFLSISRSFPSFFIQIHFSSFQFVNLTLIFKPVAHRHTDTIYDSLMLMHFWAQIHSAHISSPCLLRCCAVWHLFFFSIMFTNTCNACIVSVCVTFWYSITQCVPLYP